MSSTETRTGWPLGRVPADYVLGHVRAVLPDRVAEDSRIVVRDGRIAAVEDHPPGAGCDADGDGALCLPGLVDVHSDALERERAPRPAALLPWDFAVLSLEAKLAAAGVTTAFHGAAFQHKTARGTERTIGTAEELCAAVQRRRDGPVDHRLLLRLDVRSVGGAKALERQLDSLPGTTLVSHEDHTPGIGQYVDRTRMEEYLVGADGMSPQQAEQHVTDMVAERGSLAELRDENLAWLGALARRERIRLLGHDPESAAEIVALRTRGGAVAEFPTTVDAAEAAREHGLPVVAGAPNVLRGNSHSGNVSAAGLVSRGLVTALASDYLPSGLLGAVWRLAAETGLARAVRLVTGGPAEVAGLDDRGALRSGLRADLVLVESGGRWPVVRDVLPGGAR
ncbi:alpha-D-ribose 1-methylphosphonate 5-triphosphate diphosphatase [Saccharopolyspora sp. HNM0983]|uniref:Alpha-D-ribose 1-methylphosphonate 5-triphosphate diphosphatase n=1 Tax=Saccharopolyspora montiporae TaxID=2781240 RepID=A0A929BFD3_9PSEU|nr:alpha-D-ribose 1-methylphosphonate 5-triphosphate diphosphatase [Saccharopolyspora sp. HNM0983]MBE9376533.1 alpha-D-ribose 1-methylphosphonate 5-triphosphate diphosphatase [Saccharopolyspora sp. HNM0983]